MHLRKEALILGGAAVIACGLVAGAYASTRPSNSSYGISPVRIELPEHAAWKASIEAIVPKTPQSLAEYRAPQELSTGDAIAQELVAGYLSKKQSGTFSENDAREIAAAVIARNPIVIEPSRMYRMQDIRTDAQVSFLDYTGELTNVVSRSSQIDEHELKTFARSVGEDNRRGSPALLKSANLYASIVLDLAALRVPEAYVTEHLALVNSISSLQHVTQLMAEWNGDPLYSLAYIDAFLAAERESKLALGSLYRKLAIRAKTL
ncbi:hypothetical protein KGO06_02190 [Patescibacteria group bacterium]|nr:hypothetical protein [Patescibacteria group bacterium]